MPVTPTRSSGDGEPVGVDLSVEDLRAVVRYVAECAERTLFVFEEASPGDPRPRAAIDAAREFATGTPRSRLQRTTAVEAHRAARDAPTAAAHHAAMAAGDAAAAAYLHPIARATQVRHLLGAAAHAARAAELSRADDPVVGEYMLDAAAKRMTPEVRDVLDRYPRTPVGRSRINVLMHRLDSLLRDPPPTPRVVDPGPFFHGTRADVAPGDLLSPGWMTNYGSGKVSGHIYVTASSTGAPLAAELARGDGPPRVYRVEPLGDLEDDPNVTDKRFPGNPTRSYRTKEPVRVLDEVTGFDPPDPDLVARIRANTGSLARLGIEAMD
ncbi:MAG: NAD(+)--rifampin ADP-ribosyltransferase [Tetrasphaera sp.]